MSEEDLAAVEAIKREVDDIICRNRVYQCKECDFVGREEAADNHQAETDHCMEKIS